MGQSDGSDGQQFAGRSPNFTDRFMVPLIFEPFARDLASAYQKSAPAEVLETAAGTGVPQRALSSRLSAKPTWS